MKVLFATMITVIFSVLTVKTTEYHVSVSGQDENPGTKPNVEALMKEFKARTQGGKTKVRGRFKVSLFAFNTGIAINFGRIFRYIVEYELFNYFFLPIALLLMKNLPKNNPMVIFTRKPDRCHSNFQLIRDFSKYFSNLQTMAA